jgi:hypothetical protein
MPAPRILARFVEENGAPKYDETADRRHYHIEIFGEALPPDTYAVTYMLDPTYFDPVRESENREQGFKEEVTSYGDYPFTAKIWRKPVPEFLKASLQDALRAYYRERPATPAVNEALAWIAAH